ncbi:LCCL domain-containing protein [Blastomonas sp.]|uniref:LCCL domain-containing protein n=1 Tax=Blastomonas sp. TaxID=1909299 RepID=UPI003593433B
MSPVQFVPVLLAGLGLAASPALSQGVPAPRQSTPAGVLLLQSGASQCPVNATSYRGPGATVTCFCPASATQGGSVWGTDVYTDDSTICPAARHAGVIGGNGGSVTFSVGPGLGGYEGSTRNGVSSSQYGAWENSYSFAKGGMAPVTAAAPTVANCPANAMQFRGSRRAISCFCPATAVAVQGSVWGSDVYTDDSYICRAARHAGIVGRNGGTVNLTAMPGRASYAGTTRNGVTSSNYGAWDGSFTLGK